MQKKQCIPLSNLYIKRLSTWWISHLCRLSSSEPFSIPEFSQSSCLCSVCRSNSNKLNIVVVGRVVDDEAPAVSFILGSWNEQSHSHIAPFNIIQVKCCSVTLFYTRPSPPPPHSTHSTSAQNHHPPTSSGLLQEKRTAEDTHLSIYRTRPTSRVDDDDSCLVYTSYYFYSILYTPSEEGHFDKVGTRKYRFGKGSFNYRETLKWLNQFS